MNSPAPDASSRDPTAVRAMFDRVAVRYDLANHLLSAGCDFYWRKRAADLIAQWDPPCILDLATGSGDLALALQRRLPTSKITAADFSSEMLAHARKKGVRETIVADALHLPFANQSFDAVTVAFGLRNMRDWNAALHEMRRVLTLSGHLLVLDFSLPRNPALRPIYRFYLHKIVPKLSAIITNERDAYQYLGASIENFPQGKAMCDLIEASGFQNAVARQLTAGVVTIYTADSF